MMIDNLIPDMKKRLYTIGLFGKLTSQIRTKSQTLVGIGFETLDQQILLCFFTLRFIMEKTLQNEDCFLDDIALFLLEVNRDVFQLPLMLEDCKNLARLILVDIIGNGGEPVVFNPFEKVDDLRVSLQYVDSRLVTNPSGNMDVSYRMVDDGFHLMLSTLEMEENMRLQFQDLVFQMQLKARNYARALDEIRQIFQLLKIREAEIDQKQMMIRSNAALIDPQQYKTLNEETFALMSESRGKFEGYRQEVLVQQEGLRRLLEEEEDEKTKRMEELAELGAIDSWLAKSIMSLEKILNLLMAFSIAYDEALKQQLTYASVRRRSYRRDVYEKILEEPQLFDVFDRWIQSLFFKEPEKMLSPAMAFSYKALKAIGDEGDVEEIESGYDEEREQFRREAIAAEMRMFDEAVRNIFIKLLDSPGRKLPLSLMVQNEMPNATVNQYKQLISGLVSMQQIDLEQLRKQSASMIGEERTSFNLTLSILDAMDECEPLAHMRRLWSRRLDTRFERVFDEEDMSMTLTCSDMLFVLE